MVKLVQDLYRQLQDKCSGNGSSWLTTDGTRGWKELSTAPGAFGQLTAVNDQWPQDPAGWAALELDGRILVDAGITNQFRVNQVIDSQTFVGAPTIPGGLTVGSYLLMPQQKVAPWVYFAGRPEARIAHMQRLSGVVPPMDIDLLR